MAAPRSNKIELTERVDAAEEMMVAGLGGGTVRRQLMERFGVSERQAKEYISKVYAKWRGESASDGAYRREAEEAFFRSLDERTGEVP